MELPGDEEGDEQVVRIPEALETAVGGTTPLFDRKVDHDSQRDPHEPSRPERSCEGSMSSYRRE